MFTKKCVYIEKGFKCGLALKTGFAQERVQAYPFLMQISSKKAGLSSLSLKLNPWEFTQFRLAQNW